MEPQKIVHFLYMPLLGLGLFSGHRGGRWLRNRIQILKQFVIPSLQAQTSKNFILWISVRPQDRFDPQINRLKEYTEGIKEFRTVWTHSGVAFWDDKYPDQEARSRLADAVHGSVGELFEVIDTSSDFTYMTIQPSDDVYHREFVENIQKMFVSMPMIQALGFRNGYVMDYKTLELAEWNPETIPPFFTIKFPMPVFIDPPKHLKYIGPYKSHEYIADTLKFGFIESRGFIVGTHGSNISTVFDHPYRGRRFSQKGTGVILKDFGLAGASRLIVPFSIMAVVFRMLPYKAKRKLRYWSGEKKWLLRPLFSVIYGILRS